MDTLESLHETHLCISAQDRFTRFLASPAGKVWLDDLLETRVDPNHLIEEQRSDLLTLATRLNHSNSGPRRIPTDKTLRGERMYRVFSQTPSEGRKAQACRDAAMALDALRREGLTQSEVRQRLAEIRQRIDALPIVSEYMGETTCIG